MSRRILSICLVLGFLLLLSLIVLNTNVLAQSATATPSRTSTTIPPTKTSTAYPGSEFVGAPLSGAAPLAVQFTHTNGSTLSSCMWTFGDGATQSFSFPTPASICPSVTHTYTSAGSYTVSLRTTKSTNTFSTTTTKTNYIQVSGVALTATPTVSASQPDLVITSPPSWVWDPNAYDSANQCYHYTPVLVWNVQVKNAGSADAGGFVVNQNYDSQKTVSGLPAGQTSTLYFPFPGKPVATAAPGQPTLSASYSNFIADLPNQVSESNETNNTNRRAIPTFTRTPSGGPTKVFCKTPTPGAPVATFTPTRTPTRTSAPADFSGTPLSGNAPLMVSFTHNLGSVLPSGTLVTCTWTFGDGQSQQYLDTCFNTNHTYASAGVYTVSLQYSSAAGSGTVTKPNYISVLSGPTLTPTPTRTVTPTPGGVTPTPTVFGVCSPINADITAPFTFDGAGVFCWRSTNLGSYVNTWNVISLKINGVEYGNQYVPHSIWPPAINGYWYVSYSASAAFAHVEFR